uniref:Reverse transcriptase domain-containing protein n=1 Tax=Cannabis sativa TaxID=3483 RepID=A0A803PV88_CANSA
MQTFPKTTLYHLGFYSSDHRVLRVVLEDDSMAPPKHKRFMFENFWLTEPSFFDTVKSSWFQSSSSRDLPSLNGFLQKQQACVNDIRTWNEGFQSLTFRIRALEKSINNINSNLPLSSDNIKQVTALQSQLDSLLYKNEILWKQRSKIHWLQAGDKNTRYFHNKATVRRKKNHIRKLKCGDGRLVTSFEEICKEVCSYYGNLFQTQHSDGGATNLLLSALDKSLDTQQIHFLDSPFEANEIQQALFQLSGDKAPGIDGLNPVFYQKNWNVIGNDLTAVILNVLNNPVDLSAINETLIVLVPKKSNASTLKDFRPISLCTTLYKIVAKTLSNRLKLVLGSIISPAQSAFLSERIIFDNIFIAQELVHAINHRKQGKLGWAGLKLDMEKAFDRVEWDFLLAILRKFNFPPKFINLIHHCISSVTIRFNINGQVSDPILPSRGIRQGDPLSPYLFLLCSEGLAAALRLQEQRGFFKGISIARTAPFISHLLFADDTLLFTIASPSYCDALKEALTLYNLATGQSVNYSKSSILFSPNTPPSVRSYFFDSLHLEPGPFISKYLGVPQCFGRSKKASFDFLLQRVSSQLSVWNEKLFSKAGKEVLLKAVIQAIPSYTMSCFRLPASTCQKIEKLMAQFWWGSMGKGSQIHWKSWRTLCSSKFFGGLGFRSLVAHNQAMLAKQAWRVLSNPTSLLATVLKAKYFHHNDFLKAKLGHSPSYTWSSLLWGRDLLKHGLVWKIGNGCSVRTFEDPWIPDMKSPCLGSNDLPPVETVDFFIDHQGFWNRDKLNYYFDNLSVSSILRVPIGGLHRDDTLVWKHDPSGVFTVKSAYHLANSTSLPPSSSNPSFFMSWWKTFWNLNLPPKVKNFSWRVYHHILPVALNLFRRKTIPQPHCSFCKNPVETVTHALLDCSRAAKIWKASPFRTFYLSNRYVDVKEFMLNGFDQLNKDSLSLLLSIMWAIWNSRNKKLFANSDMAPTDIVAWTHTFISDYQEALSNVNRYKSARILQRNDIDVTVPVNSYRLNTDAALSTERSKLGIGAVVKDWKGCVVANLAIPAAGALQSTLAEALALKAGLNWCQHIKIPLALVETDSKLLVDKVLGGKNDLSALSDIVTDIRNSLSFFPNVILRHTRRQFNGDAHNLARRALGLDEESCWNALLPVL